MRAVRLRDKFCRFPLCGCRRFNLTAHVAHQIHRGMGGNPALDRTVPDKMMLLCSARHKENVISLDRGTLRVRPLTNDKLSGPCAFDVDIVAMGYMPIKTGRPRWLEVGRETALHVFEPSTPEQAVVLTALQQMTPY